MKIVVLDALTFGDSDLSGFNELGDVEIFQTTSKELTAKRVEFADVIVTNKVVITKDIMQKSKNLKLICVAATGMNNVDLEAAKELNIEVKNEYLESEYANLLFEKSTPTVLQDSDIVMDYEFKTISATKLKTYLSCKRKFYYRYVKELKEHTIAKDMPNEWEIGSDIHEALKNLYLKKDSYFSVDELKKDLYFELDCLNIDSELEHYLIEIQKRKLEKFCVNEVKRFNDGYKVVFCEKSFQTPYNGLILNGQIDRIDKKDNKFTVIDYKTGNIPIYNKNNYQDATDFQLEFYYLLASGIGNIEDSFFYNLKDSTLILEPFFKEKLEILKAHLKDLTQIKSINFEKTENEKECEFCEFSLICNR